MPPIDQSPVAGNRLVGALSEKDATALLPHLELQVLGARRVIEVAGRPIEHVYFPRAGIASTIAGQGGRSVEVSLFGREGMSGQAVVMGNGRAAHQCVMQVGGDGWRMECGALRVLLREREGLRTLFLRYFQTVMIQTSHTALSNGLARLEERLARWLLMCHDRVDGDELRLTHDFVATMLGVRRAGVTVALNRLEGLALVENDRGSITVIDRGGLEKAAGRTYGAPEAEYARLVGVSLRRR